MTDPYFGNPHQPHGRQPQYGYGQPGSGYNQDYGQPGYPPPPGAQGYVSYGQGTAPPHVYVPTPMSGMNELSTLEDNGQLWLMVAAAGFFFGFGWITGPLAWYQGSKLRRQYRALGHHPGTSVNWARGLGIATTVIYYGGMALLFSALAIGLGLLAL
ncbi:MAG TPA: hypothetical protein VM869_11795 [Enhygromyxa sp.]|nr:hypothetical protein [Enhygromyxa sp.]